MKIDRHAKILQLIDENAVETQDDLARLLKENGINVTQATVSRDIRELKLVKVMMENGGYKYSAYSSEGTSLDTRIVTIFREAVTAIDYAGNFVCLHTIVGMANAAAVAIDSTKNHDIIGCVAGDDTIFIMLRSEEKAKQLLKYYKNMIKK